MFTISSYSFHQLVSRFLWLWRYVQVVSDCLTFVLALLCCQCWDAMPLSSFSSYSSKHSDILQSPDIDAGRASGEPLKAQHLTIDFTPQADDNEETSTRCQQFWQFITSQPELENMMTKPVTSAEPLDVPSRLIDHKSSLDLVTRTTEKVDYPAIHAIKKIEKKGAVETALNTKNPNRFKK